MKIITRAEAKAQGLKGYFTGRPCIYGHIDVRRTFDGRCRECDRLKAAKAHAALRDDELYKEKNKDRASRWYKQNKERACAANKLWARNNTEKKKKIQKAYYERHKDRILVEEKARRQENIEAQRARARKWRRENRAKVCASTRARQAGLRTATPDWADRDSILIKYRESQRMTALTGVLHHVDHKIPLKGENVCGLHVAANLRVILARDNLLKSNKWETYNGR